jgi:hypothetical protein
MYDYYLGGKDHFEVDREAAEKVAAEFPTIFIGAQANRGFMQRATKALIHEHGIRQWLDIGTGIPTEPNLHQVAQSLAPEARVVYVDNDPLVLKYAQTLMRSTPEGRTAYIHADVNEPDTILNALQFREVLDLTKPVALSLMAIMHFVTDSQDPWGIVDRLMGELPSGSALVLSHGTTDFDPEAWEKITEIYDRGGTPLQFRPKQEVARFFAGLDLLEPGMAVGHRWRPEPVQDDTGASREEPTDAEISLWVGVAIKP